MQQYGGLIGVTSTFGEGSTFSFSFPYELQDIPQGNTGQARPTRDEEEKIPIDFTEELEPEIQCNPYSDRFDLEGGPCELSFRDDLNYSIERHPIVQHNSSLTFQKMHR